MSEQPTRGDRGGGPALIGLSLGTARIIVGVMCASLAAYISIGVITGPLIRLTRAPSLGWIVLAVGIADYGASLLLERYFLSVKLVKESPASVRVAEGRAALFAIGTASFGVTIAVYGLILYLLSFNTWAWYLYGLSALHGIHLQLRWDRYEEAVRRATGYVG